MKNINPQVLKTFLLKLLAVALIVSGGIYIICLSYRPAEGTTLVTYALGLLLYILNLISPVHDQANGFIASIAFFLAMFGMVGTIFINCLILIICVISPLLFYLSKSSYPFPKKHIVIATIIFSPAIVFMVSTHFFYSHIVHEAFTGTIVDSEGNPLSDTDGWLHYINSCEKDIDYELMLNAIARKIHSDDKGRFSLERYELGQSCGKPTFSFLIPVCPNEISNDPLGPVYTSDQYDLGSKNIVIKTEACKPYLSESGISYEDQASQIRDVQQSIDSGEISNPDQCPDKRYSHGDNPRFIGCIFALAKKNKDSSICQKLSGISGAELAYIHDCVNVVAQETGDTNICSGSIRCLILLAQAKHDSKICDQLNTGKPKNVCLQLSKPLTR